MGCGEIPSKRLDVSKMYLLTKIDIIGKMELRIRVLTFNVTHGLLDYKT